MTKEVVFLNEAFQRFKGAEKRHIITLIGNRSDPEHSRKSNLAMSYLKSRPNPCSPELL